MAKRLKLRISRVIQSCRSKDPSNLPKDPVPSFPRLSHVDFPPATPLPSKPHRSSFKRHVFGCGLNSKSGARSPSFSDRTESPPAFNWQKEEKWHVIAVAQHETPRRKIYNSSASDDDLSPPPPPPPTLEAKKRRSKKKKPTARFRISTSSAESGLFSDDREREESETLITSSRSFSTDSSSENPVPRRRRRRRNKNGKGDAWEGEAARLSVFRRMIPCVVEGKVKESFAVVTKSQDPYKDFKRSMVEMILEKQMFEERELEQLLQCFLSLNSRHHHAVIVQAFAEILEALFCRTSTSHGRFSTASSLKLDV